MSRRGSLVWLAIAAVAAAAFSGWALAPAFSSSLDPMLKAKGLSKAKAKKLFYTKKASDKRYYSKADSDARYYSKAESDSRYYSKSEADGKFVTKADADASYLSSSGATTLQASPLTWQQTLGASSAIVQRGSEGITLLSGPATTAAVVIAPTFPSELSGQPMQLIGVNACYATTTSTTVTQARINVGSNTTGVTNFSVSPVVDATPRTDDACRDYTAPTPVPIGPDQFVTFQFDVSFAGGGGNAFTASRATFYVEPAG